MAACNNVEGSNRSTSPMRHKDPLTGDTTTLGRSVTQVCEVWFNVTATNWMVNDKTLQHLCVRTQRTVLDQLWCNNFSYPLPSPPLPSPPLPSPPLPSPPLPSPPLPSPPLPSPPLPSPPLPSPPLPRNLLMWVQYVVEIPVFLDRILSSIPLWPGWCVTPLP